MASYNSHSMADSPIITEFLNSIQLPVVPTPERIAAWQREAKKCNRMPDDRMDYFLRMLEATGCIRAAARAATPWAKGKCATTFYQLAQRDPNFRQRMDDARSEAAAALALEARRRAIEGTLELTYDKHGNVVSARRRQSDSLLALLPKHTNDEFRTKIDVNHTHTHGIDGPTLQAIRERAAELAQDTSRFDRVIALDNES